jgi:hypothetical protein
MNSTRSLLISALEEHHITVTALHSHMLTEQPRLFFMHFWAADNTESVAEGIKAALGRIIIKSATTASHYLSTASGPAANRRQTGTSKCSVTPIFSCC